MEEFLQVPRLWKPAIGCPVCFYPNDLGFFYCQKCGNQKEPASLADPPKAIDVDSERVNRRLELLNSYQSNKPYQRRKSHLQVLLESYLWSLPGKRTLSNASPQDVVTFLVWRDKFGKTTLHSNICAYSLLRPGSCSCPKTLAARIIDNNIEKLRSIFRENGRGSLWNDDLHLGNPAAHLSVRQYQAMVLEEKTIARTFPAQATPLFLNKLKLVCSHLRQLAIAPSTKSSDRYIFARDLAFFAVDFFSGDRGSDLGRVKSKDVLRLPGKSGFLINQVFGKHCAGMEATFLILNQSRVPHIALLLTCFFT